jgi:CHAD domain-containing protein
MDEVMSPQTLESYREFGAKALLERVHELNLHIAGVREAADIEFVHQMRVASRRLRAAMGLFEEALNLKPFKKAIKRITGDLGDARDLDVQISFLEKYLQKLSDPVYAPGIKRIALRLRQQRETVQAHVIEALDRLEKSAALEEMSQKMRETLVQARLRGSSSDAAGLRIVAATEIDVRLQELLSYEPCVNNAASVDQHHQMRIAAKKLRYTMEIFASLFPPALTGYLDNVKEVQKILGDIHDSDVWVLMLPAFIAEENRRTKEYFGNLRPMKKLLKGMEYLRGERADNRAQLHTQFMALWERLVANRTWQNLQLLLRTADNDNGAPSVSNPEQKNQSELSTASPT